MGADRRGPLAAFIILAVIAVILLVTSVRSQAASGWFRTTVVAGPLSEPNPWGTGDVAQGVQNGVSAGVVSQRVAPAKPSARHQVAGAHRPDRPASTPQRPGGSPAPPADEKSTSSSTHDHGRHLGWYEGHGNGHARGHDHSRGWLPVDVGSHGRGH